MSDQIFISYRREGGDIYAKAICDALKVRGYSVFYDFDSLQGGYFDDRIYRAIEECNDFVLVLPPNSLDRCVNEDDWVRLEIKHALDCGKNIIPVMLPGFSFPKTLPSDIANVARINGIPFIMHFFDRAVIPEIIDRFSLAKHTSAPSHTATTTQFANQNSDLSKAITPQASQGLIFTLNNDGYAVTKGTCTDKKITIPRLYRGNPVTRIHDFAFDGLSSLTSITIPNSVTTIGEYAFLGCNSLMSITIPDSVTNIERGAFSYCGSLTSITIPNSIANIEAGAFSYCRSLTSIAIPDSVTNIEPGTFEGCSSLKSITIPNNAISIKEAAFCGCVSLTSIAIPKNVKSIGDDAFLGCVSLTSITIPKNIKNIDSGAFEGCSSLDNIYYNGSVSEWKNVRLGLCCFPPCIAVIHCTNGDFRL